MDIGREINTRGSENKVVRGADIRRALLQAAG
jgi:hypothetical protein